MSTEDRRRFPLWVPIAAAAAGAVVAFGAVAVLDLDRDDYVTVIPASQPAAPLASAQDQATAAPGDDRSTFDAAPTAPASAAGSTADDAASSSGTDAPSTTSPASDTVISREEAGAIAAAHVGGVVDSIHTENDYGAAWDVDVYAPDGEYTIYVSATGQIVRVMGPYDWD